MHTGLTCTQKFPQGPRFRSPKLCRHRQQLTLLSRGSVSLNLDPLGSNSSAPSLKARTRQDNLCHCNKTESRVRVHQRKLSQRPPVVNVQNLKGKITFCTTKAVVMLMFSFPFERQIWIESRVRTAAVTRRSALDGFLRTSPSHPSLATPDAPPGPLTHSQPSNLSTVLLPALHLVCMVLVSCDVPPPLRFTVPRQGEAKRAEVYQTRPLLCDNCQICDTDTVWSLFIGFCCQFETTLLPIWAPVELEHPPNSMDASCARIANLKIHGVTNAREVVGHFRFARPGTATKKKIPTLFSFRCVVPFEIRKQLFQATDVIHAREVADRGTTYPAVSRRAGLLVLCRDPW